MYDDEEELQKRLLRNSGESTEGTMPALTWHWCNIVHWHYVTSPGTTSSIGPRVSMESLPCASPDFEIWVSVVTHMPLRMAPGALPPRPIGSDTTGDTSAQLNSWKQLMVVLGKAEFWLKSFHSHIRTSGLVFNTPGRRSPSLHMFAFISIFHWYSLARTVPCICIQIWISS